MEALQITLTLTAEAIALAAFIGLPLHAIWSSHQRWMRDYCPPVTPYTPEVQATAAEALPEQPEASRLIEVDELIQAIPSKTVQYQQPAFEGYSKTRLRAVARELQIKRYSRLDRPELITAIASHPLAKEALTA